LGVSNNQSPTERSPVEYNNNEEYNKLYKGELEIDQQGLTKIKINQE
jgi:hypothetical protein